ncbi:hypothetical protein [Burkholderia ubonensis]|uniref:hypothetical protein n=1 Tax=Burkholderia ubonensis TaxID=101571 RepID=UPI000A5E88BD|nr:hypothetical protein [Burkholderia ubonensis]
MMIANTAFPPNNPTPEQRKDYKKLELTPGEYLKLLNTGHPGGVVSVAQASGAEAAKRM